MQVLVLGGTRFLGRHLVRALLDRGHGVTLFHRGRSGAGLFADEGVPHLAGDRDGGLAPLEQATRGRRLDAVVDTSGYLPRVVEAGCRLLADRAERYLFVSSVSAYAETEAASVDEDAPLAALEDAASEDIAAHYGALKAACEAVLRRGFGAARSLVVRPGLIVGPHDPTGRFTYWPLRLAAGGTVLAPEPRQAPVQVIDVRDLAAWMVALLERQASGVLNAAGPARPLTFAAMLETCRAAVDPAARLEWVDARFLLERGVRPWTGLPLWLAGEAAGLDRIDLRRALDNGLVLRDLQATVRDTLAWAREAGQPLERGDGVGLGREQEAALLAAWRERKGAGA